MKISLHHFCDFFLFASFPSPPATHVNHEAGLGRLQEILWIFPFLASRDIPVPFLATPLRFTLVRLFHSSHNPWDTLCLSWERLFCSEAEHTVGPTQPSLLKQHLVLLQENPKCSSVCGGKLHSFLQTCFSTLSQLITFPDALQLCVLGAVKAPQKTLPKQAAPALQHPTTLSPPKAPTHLP